ncbi:MAG: pyrimidine/purine nucleoside phosphorylase [Firmicutes bacterium]|nr:pyrimidine/purine nucleoside phosphorylase [Bacillota bacterium]
MVPEKISNVEMMSKANVYWDGKVTSRTFFRAGGSKHTPGIITAGTYIFGVGDREIVTLIAGEVEVKRPVDSDWVRFKTPEAFEIQANCDYDIRTYGVAEYLCDYYKD